MRRAIHDRAAQFFTRVGLPYLRFNLYDTRDGTRNLSDHLTIEDHVSDLRAVIAYARTKGVKKIHVGGYSLTAYPLVVAASDPVLEIQSAVFWDGSHPTQPPLEASNYLHWRSEAFTSRRGELALPFRRHTLKASRLLTRKITPRPGRHRLSCSLRVLGR